MQDSTERNTRLKAIHGAPLHVWIVLAGCATGLAMVTLVCAVGVARPIAQPAAAGPAQNVTHSSAQRVQEHRKQVYDERRQSWQGRGGRESVADKSAGPADQLLLARPQQISHWR